MTRRQKEVLDFIRTFIGVNGYSPTMRQIKDGCQMTAVSNAYRIVVALEEQGVIKRKSRRGHRCVELTEPNTAAVTDMPFDVLVQELGRRGWFVVKKDDLTLAQLRRS